ncbi:MAG: permease-like cell division protein FtsX [Candidatus Kapaibacterium sp.]
MTFGVLLAEGITSIRRVAGASAIGALMTGVALAIVGGFTLMALAYRADLEAARASATVEVFLNDGIDSARGAAVAAEITGFPAVESARVRSRAEAMRLFGEGMSGDGSIVKDDLPLPVTIRLEVQNDARTVKGMTDLRARLRNIRDVEDVAFPGELVRAVDERTQSFFRIALVAGIALALSVVGVVGITAQLTVVSRRSVIRTMRLLGAERRWVIAPFLIQGTLIGLAGGIIAAAALYGAWLVFPGLEGFMRGSDLARFPLLFPIAGGTLGVLGSALAGGYYLRRKHPL